jgi:hypothetical protein
VPSEISAGYRPKFEGAGHDDCRDDRVSIGTFAAALAFQLLGRARSLEGVEDQVRRLWRERPKGRFVAV